MSPATGSAELTTKQVQSGAHAYRGELPKAQLRQNPPPKMQSLSEKSLGKERHFGALPESVLIMTECAFINYTRQ